MSSVLLQRRNEKIVAVEYCNFGSSERISSLWMLWMLWMGQQYYETATR
jgi:hypothetical protein